MLKAALGKNRHIESCNGPHSAADNFAFELIELLYVVVGQIDEGETFGLLDDFGPGEGAEALKTKVAGRRVCPRIRATQPTRVS